MRPETDPWWRQARADLETARLTYSVSRYYAASWFAQQAVEKGLKALYTDQHVIEPALTRFAVRLRDEIGASRVLLFGSRARGQAREDSDYDLIIVAPFFADIEPLCRGMGLRQLWRQEGGIGPMDLFCLTPEEYTQARQRQQVTLIATVLPEAIDLLSAVPVVSIH